MRNNVEFQVTGRYALFSDPLTRAGGEKFTYNIPTYQALKGILESVYWKPTFIWYIDSVRVMNQIRTQSVGVKTMNLDNDKSDLSMYCYLKDVKYQVKAHFEFNMNRPEFAKDMNENKHHNIAKRMIEKGGRRDIFLGTRECQGYVEPISFGEGTGYYDHSEEIEFGTMIHGFSYPDETGDGRLKVRLWRPKFNNGIIEFIRPENCEIVRDIRKMEMKKFDSNKNDESDESVSDYLSEMGV